MEYIIVWRSTHRDPFISTNSHYFKETFSSYEDALHFAMQNQDGEHCHDYEIFQTADLWLVPTNPQE